MSFTTQLAGRPGVEDGEATAAVTDALAGRLVPPMLVAVTE
jgi:hypothetical protein